MGMAEPGSGGAAGWRERGRTPVAMRSAWSQLGDKACPWTVALGVEAGMFDGGGGV